MDTVIVKFGGTSVATEENRAQAISHIAAMRAAHKRVAVVVSAMGRKGSPYATDTLLSLLKSAQPAIRDLLLSCGETISACVFADELIGQGIPAVAMTGAQAGILTNGAFGGADILDMDTMRVEAALREGAVPVITGFQGVNVRGEVTTLGRGGSDTSAVAIGNFLNATDVYIFTDVPGVAVMDPRIVPSAPFFKEVGLEHMHALARWGAGVIHPRAVAAARPGMNLWVRSTFDTAPGTRIAQDAPMRQGPVGMALLRGYEAVPCEKQDTLVMSDGEQRMAARPVPGGAHALLTVAFHGLNAQQMLARVRETAQDAPCFASELCAHILIEAEQAAAFAQTLYSRLF